MGAPFTQGTISVNKANHDHVLDGHFQRRDSYRGKTLATPAIGDTRDQSVFRASCEACVPVEIGRQGLILQKKLSVSEALPEDTKQPRNSFSSNFVFIPFSQPGWLLILCPVWESPKSRKSLKSKALPSRQVSRCLSSSWHEALQDKPYPSYPLAGHGLRYKCILHLGLTSSFQCI